MAVFHASQGIGCGSSGGIVDSTELFTKLFRGRQDYQRSSLNTVRIASFSSPRDMSSWTNLLPVNGFIHAGTAVRKTSLEAWLPMPGLSLTWTKIVGAFRENEFVKTFMAQSVLEKDAQQQQHISTPNIRVDHIGDSASEPNRGGAGQHKRRSASADAVAAPPAQAARSEDGPCGGRAEADGEVPGGAAAGAGPTGGVSADGASPGGSGGRGGGAGGAATASAGAMFLLFCPPPPRFA